MDFTQYIKPELLLLLPVLWALGTFMKATPKVRDWAIPYALMGVSVFLSGLWVFATEGVSPMGVFTAITQGLLVAGTSVGANQLVKQAGKRGE